MKQLKTLLVAGARPNFMKIAPLIKAIERHNEQDAAGIDWRLVHTGQHYDQKMSDIFFGELGIPAPHINLNVGSGTQATQTANVMTEFEPVCGRERPDWVIVVGDVNSTVACTLVAAKLGIKVAHVEAGLRSYDRTMPEEINRLVTDALADLLFTPSADADENLRREGIPDSKIRLVGNIMIDALIANLDRARGSSVLQHHGIEQHGFAYVTLHRPSNVDDPGSLNSIMDRANPAGPPDCRLFSRCIRAPGKCARSLAFPAETKTACESSIPIGYHDSLCLTENARLVLTDSGGLQEETTFFKTPCLTLRPNTERPITISIGSNRLTNIEALAGDIARILSGAQKFGEIPPLWDGKTAERIVAALADTGDGKHTAARPAKQKQPSAC